MCCQEARKLHSTEIALIRVHNDIAIASDPLSHIHVCDERCAGFTKKRETLEFSSMNL